jgi:hypothetical protein
MNIRTLSCLAVAVAVLLPDHELRAQTQASLAPFIAEARSVTAENTLAARASRAYNLAVTGQFREARREYSALVREQRKAHVYAGDSMRMLSQLEYGTGRTLAAARVLDGLAAEAEKYGHPDDQARAILDAAVLYQKLGRTDDLLTRVERLLPLKDSPCVSEQLRARIRNGVQR